MQGFKSVLNFYINASFHVALASLSLVQVTAIEFGLELHFGLNVFVFCATVFAYNFVKYYGVAKHHYKSLTSKIVWIRVVMWLAFFGMLFCSFFLNRNTILFAVFLALITLLYAQPLKVEKLRIFSISNLRNMAGIKVYIIALVWSGASVGLPVIDSGIDFTKQISITGLQRFVMLVVLMLPFEIRDLQFDDLKLETIPQKIGEKTTKILGFILIAFIVLLEYAKGIPPNNHMLTLLIILFMLAFLLYFVNTKRNIYYTAFWVEAIPIIWILLLLLL